LDSAVEGGRAFFNARDQKDIRDAKDKRDISRNDGGRRNPWKSVQSVLKAFSWGLQDDVIRFGNGDALFAEGAVVREPAFHADGGEGIETAVGGLEVGDDSPTASVNQYADADDGRTAISQVLDTLQHRPAGGDNVFDDEDVFAGSEQKPAFQRHATLAVLFGIRGPDAQHTGGFVSERNAARGGPDHQIDPVAGESVGEGRTEFDGDSRILHRARGLEKLPAMPSARVEEMAFEQRALLAE
jgi:hypothetical protein